MVAVDDRRHVEGDLERYVGAGADDAGAHGTELEHDLLGVETIVSIAPGLDVQTVVGADRSGGLLGEETTPAEHCHRRRIRLRRGLEAWGIPRLDDQGLVRHCCTSAVA